MTYTVDGQWLCCNGERVLFCDGYTPGQMEMLREQYQADADAPKHPIPQPCDAMAVTQSHMDSTARQRGYDTADRCASYVNSTNPTWAAEAAAFVAWRDACWSYVFGLTPPYPTVTELLAALPVMEWPR